MLILVRHPGESVAIGPEPSLTVLVEQIHRHRVSLRVSSDDCPADEYHLRTGEGQQIALGIHLYVYEVTSGRVRLGFDAPADVVVIRGELAPIVASRSLIPNGPPLASSCTPPVSLDDAAIELDDTWSWDDLLSLPVSIPVHRMPS